MDAVSPGTTEGARRDQVVDAAVRALESDGPAFGMSRVAELAGIQRPNLYRLFASRETLELAVYRRAATDLTERVRPNLHRPGTIAEVVTAVVGSGVAWAAEHPQLYRFLAAQEPAVALRDGREGRAPFLGEIFDAVQAYLHATDADATVPRGVLASLMGMVDAGIVWWLDQRDEPLEALAQRLARQVTRILLDTVADLGLDVPSDLVLDPMR